MDEIIKIITPWIAVIVAVIAGYITLRNQMRLKAFELLLEHRTDLLKAIEAQINFYRSVLAELKTEQDITPNLNRFCQVDFHDSLILLHRAKGVALGPLANSLIETYWSVSTEAISKNSINKTEAKSIIEGKINTLAVFYGFAHRRISSEIELLTLSNWERIKRMIGIQERLRTMPVSKKDTQQQSRH